MLIMKRFVVAILVVCLSFSFLSCNSDEKEVSNDGFMFGIDVSHHNGDIDWATVKHQQKTKDPIKFVIMRSSAGVDGEDTCYLRNYKDAKEQGFIVGSYHYYRPNENSTKQFENFKKALILEKGDIIPVVDIEVESTVQTMESLKIGLRKFITLCEKEYGVKPIIYTKFSMWRDFLQTDFSDCKLWVAAYTVSRREEPIVQNASIHQFTHRIKNIPGIPSKYVDGDDIRDVGSLIYWYILL